MSEVNQQDKKNIPDSLNEKLTSENSDDRRWAVYDLEQYAPEETAPLLITAIQDVHRAVRESASEMLETIPPSFVSKELVPLLGSERIEIRNIVADILTRFGDAAVEDLIDALKHGNEDVRKFAADILGLNGSLLAVKGLCKSAFEDEVDNVSSAAVMALGKIGSPDALETLYKVVTEKVDVRGEAIEAIGLIGDEKSAEFLESQLGHGTTLIQYAVIDALGNLGTDNSIEKLKVFFLGQAPDSLVEPILSSILKIAERKRINLCTDDTWFMLKTAANIMKASNDAIADLMAFQLSFNQEESVLNSFYDYAENFPSSLLVSLVNASGNHPSLKNNVANLARNDDEWVAYSAIETLEKYGADEVGELLIQLLKEMDGMPVVAAIRSVVALGLKNAVPVIETLMNSTNHDIQETAKQALTDLS